MIYEMEETNRPATAVEDDEIFSLKDFLYQCIRKWQWFAASILIFCCLGVFYILRQQPEYSRSMSVLIKDQDGGGSVSELAGSFASMGLVSSNTNVNNELITITSPAVMYEVIKRLGLDVNYEREGRFHDVTLYGSNLPFTALFADIEEQQNASFKMDYDPSGKVVLYDFHKVDEGEPLDFPDKRINATIDGTAIRTPIGRIVLSPNPAFVAPKKGDKPGVINVSRRGMQSTVEHYNAELHADLTNKDADIIDLSIRDVSVDRAVDILNTTLNVYNQNWVEDKNIIAVATSQFIDERLQIIEKELGHVDNEIMDYKSENKVPDIEQYTKYSFDQDAKMTEEMLDKSNELAMAQFVKEYLSNPQNANSVIPVNTGIGNQQLEQQIVAYNNVLLNRNTLANNSSDQNPIVLDYDAQLRGLREAIVKAVNNQVLSLNRTMDNMRAAKSTAQSQLASGPTQAKFLLSVERQQKVKEALYLYLLQKREENELSQTFTAYNTRVITPPMGSLRPVAPKKKLILAVMFILGALIPAAFIYIAQANNTRIRSRKDLDKMSTPFAGEIPFAGKSSSKKLKQLLAKLKKDQQGHDDEQALAVVKQGSRDPASEAFRIVRGNLDFMMREDSAENVLMVTSFNPGSGKSFVAYNLAASYGLKGKKVLIVDCDLRHGSASQFVGMPSRGLSNYLTGSTTDWQKLIVPIHDNPGVFMMPIGHRPPNPAELLDNGRIGEFINEAKKEYDYILVDCPPVDVVVDTQIMEKYTDRTLFVVRAGLLERKSIIEIDEIYKNRRLKKMSVILNGTEPRNSRSHTYGTYGYYNGQ